MAKMRKGAKKKAMRPSGLSKYQEKLKQRELEEIIDVAPPEENPKDLFRDPSLQICTYINYLSRKDKPAGIIIRPKSDTNSIYSLVITTHDKEIRYTLNKRHTDNHTEWKTIETEFKRLYNDAWIDNTREAQCELYVMEQAIQDKRKQIEEHLGTKL